MPPFFQLIVQEADTVTLLITHCEFEPDPQDDVLTNDVSDCVTLFAVLLSPTCHGHSLAEVPQLEPI